MSTVTEKMLNEIRGRLSRIATDIRFDNISGLYDRNSHMERFFKQILNAIYDYNLVTTNLNISNYPAIDLKDASRRVAYQVTSTNSNQKINKTVKTFLDNDMGVEIDLLRFLILKDIDGPMVSKGSYTTMEYEVFTIYDLGRVISDLHDESKIKQIHEIVMIEYIVADGGAVGVKCNSSYKLSSIQGLIKQAGFDLVDEVDEIEVYKNEFESFVKILSGLTVEQRTTLYELVFKCQFVKNDHKTIYLSTSRLQAEFDSREKVVVDSLVDIGLIEVDREFSVNYVDPEIVALVMKCPSQLELNIFAELKIFANGDSDILQKMLISLNYDCLGD